MLTIDEVRQISQKLSLENGISTDTLSEEISSITYYIDLFPYGDTPIIDRHIEIEYTFGEYYEIPENTPLFSLICTLCNLPLFSKEEKQIILYQKDD